ncbi:hypothetical protein [Siphonobacter sp.]|uniref:hypothetical protein n=1 Tax=Siphonobacter sp. TaxID=1869184 RepID=UPI003B3BE79E
MKRDRSLQRYFVYFLGYALLMQGIGVGMEVVYPWLKGHPWSEAWASYAGISKTLAIAIPAAWTYVQQQKKNPRPSSRGL